MTAWQARFERTVCTDVGRLAGPWPRIATSFGSDHREQAVVMAIHAVHTGGGPTSDGTGEVVVEAQNHDDAVIVVIAGEFDLAIADPVREALTHAIREARQRLVIDLGAVTFIDSTGLHVILEAYKLCRDVGVEVTIRPGPPNVQDVFELTGLLGYLPFEITD